VRRTVFFIPPYKKLMPALMIINTAAGKNDAPEK
jgi:hypothetical protein